MKPREHQNMLAVNVGLVANLFLAAIKTTIGMLGHSPALLADGIMSTSDVAYYVTVAIFIRLARKPADEEHPYGHSQMESIAALVIGSFVLTTGVAILWNSVNGVYDLMTGQRSSEGATLAALAVAILSIVLKIGLTVFTRQIGRQTNSAAVMAMAYDHRNDIFSATAAAVGIFLGQRGLPWVDPLAGALVALVILRTGIEILRSSSADLMDTVPGRALAQEVREALHDVPGIQQLEAVHAHRFGPYLVLNVTIGIDARLSVAEGDMIASKVEEVLCRRIEFVRQVYVHYHPTKRGQLVAGQKTPIQIIP
ncbi:MAG: cation diffusion facilitator family transporter [Anaerolineae bacterium]|nr:cation diffusion facilitator family transporter [Anaerolineae bacterium]